MNIAGKLGVNRANLVGCSTGNELVTEVSLVLGSLLVLDMVMISVALHLLQECIYLVVTLSIVVAVVEPTHDDDDDASMKSVRGISSK